MSSSSTSADTNPTKQNLHHPQTEQTPENQETMAITHNPLKLTLILAATPSLGIGKNGTLPWPQLRKEMGYFACVTKYVPHSIRSSAAAEKKVMNAVVMGRKTWESIPEKFRPLKGRVNVVISGSLPASPSPYLKDLTDINGVDTHQGQPNEAAKAKDEGPIIIPTLSTALDFLSSLSFSPPSPAPETTHSTLPSNPQNQQQDTTAATPSLQIYRTFIIGGAQLYKTCLALPQTNRILLTRVREEFDCDAFFPVELSDGNGSGSEWRRVKEDDWREWTGENVGVAEEGKLVNMVEREKGVEFEFGMWVRG